VTAATDGEAVVEVRGVDVSYGRVQVLFDVALSVGRGETVALVGTNGAGKSTLLKAISGLAPVQRGELRLLGRDVTAVTAERRVTMGIVHLLGGAATFPPLTVGENLRMAGFGCPSAELDERIERATERFRSLRERRDSQASDLSGGQQQMLALAMALVRDPEVLLIDELSLGLAPVVVRSVLDVVRELQDEGLTMVIVEQSLHVACSIADRAVFMEKGAIRYDGPARELTERNDLARAVFLER
jgi:ABC-type branched-subunit amino acid transport system ATPase component